MEAGHGTVKTYLWGFLLSLLLTCAAFWLVLSGLSLDPTLRYGGLALLAVIQIGVQMHYFLHLNTSSGQLWNLMALLYTLLIVILLVGGSLWIMHNANMHMMSGMES
ncbi:MAG: cytochrome o ubiquinol oxidase subunit IV [Ferrovum sp.]|nr:cytochrome o ubiquinol oxidase subunit IV [Ferrovum sp.]NDU87489.1 cytochrome o ubiquinol oxidase subunit IV [Ferrovum sp.]